MSIDSFVFNEIEKKCISVIDVTMAKGIEASHVLVLDDSFTKNELYIACTRALYNLYYTKFDKLNSR